MSSTFNTLPGHCPTTFFEFWTISKTFNSDETVLTALAEGEARGKRGRRSGHPTIPLTKQYAFRRFSHIYKQNRYLKKRPEYYDVYRFI